MTGLQRRIGAIVVALATAIALPSPAQAHGGDEGLVVEPATTSPGGAVSVRGDLPTTSSIVLVLASPAGVSLTLGRVEEPPEGHFETVVTVPPEATSGTWHLEARVAGTVLAESELTVTGSASAGGAADDRAEPVAVPSGSASQALSAIRPAAMTVAEQPAEPSPGAAWWPYAVLAVAALGAVGWSYRQRTGQVERVLRARTPRR
jgi:hypothetical protein